METRHLQTGALITFQNFPFVSRLALGFWAGVCAGKSAQSWLSLALLPTPPPPMPGPPPPVPLTWSRAWPGANAVL